MLKCCIFNIMKYHKKRVRPSDCTINKLFWEWWISEDGFWLFGSLKLVAFPCKVEPNRGTSGFQSRIKMTLCALKWQPTCSGISYGTLHKGSCLQIGATLTDYRPGLAILLLGMERRQLGFGDIHINVAELVLGVAMTLFLHHWLPPLLQGHTRQWCLNSVICGLS